MSILARPRNLAALVLVVGGASVGALAAERGLGLAGTLIASVAGLAATLYAAEGTSAALRLVTRAARRARARERLPALSAELGDEGAELWEELDLVSVSPRALPSGEPKPELARGEAKGADLDERLRRIDEGIQSSVAAAIDVTSKASSAAEHAATLERAMGEALAGADAVAASSKSAAQHVEALRALVDEASAACRTVDASTAETRERAEAAARLGEDLAQDAERSASGVRRALDEVSAARRGADETAAVIARLGEHIASIGKITRVIDEITERTNLLALNAAILAAQAGEHGKGFAVVADEIKDLAERAADSTSEIVSLIETAQHESRDAAIAVERGAFTGQGADEPLRSLVERAQRSATSARAVAQSMSEHARGARAAAESLARVT